MILIFAYHFCDFISVNLLTVYLCDLSPVIVLVGFIYQSIFCCLINSVGAD